MALHHTFSGKKVLITGGGQGIGRAIVQRLYEDNAEVFVIEKQEALIQKLRKDFPKIRAVCVDLLDWDATKEAILKWGVPFDHLVNNAGIEISEDFMNITPAAFDKTMGVNTRAVICVTQAVADGMIQSGGGGSIVNIASVAARMVSFSGMAVYSASKAAVVMLTKAIAFELGKHNIRLNCISPSAVATEFAKPFLEQDYVLNLFERSPLRPNIIQPDQVADLVLFLLSPKSEMMTGAEVPIDVGITFT